jgi:hypothetical protein
MNRLVRRYIILFLAIIIPLAAAFWVGSYGYNSKKFGQGTWRKEFEAEYLSFEDSNYTTKDKIERYLEYGINYQYDSFSSTPLYEKEIKSDNGEKLFDMLVYRVVYDLDGKGSNRFQYLFMFYNVQYLKLRELFPADENRRKEIDNANVPTFDPKIEAIEDENEDYGDWRPQFLQEDRTFPDYDADVDFVSGKKAHEDDEIGSEDSLVQVYIGRVRMRDIDIPKNYKITVNVTIGTIMDDEGNSIKAEAAKFDMFLEPNPENVDYSGYSRSYKQLVDAKDLKAAGYIGWVFKNYLWWIGLVTFVAIGLITGSFYFVYVSEEKRALAEAAKGNKKKKR